MEKECVIDRMSLFVGYVGVYSSILRPAQRYGVSGTEIFFPTGERKFVRGQTAQPIGIAVVLATVRAGQDGGRGFA